MASYTLAERTLEYPEIEQAYKIAFGVYSKEFKERLYLLALDSLSEKAVAKKTYRINRSFSQIFKNKLFTDVNYYISANTFVDYKDVSRTKDNIFGLRNIVIDVDFHEENDVTHLYKEKFLKNLKELWEMNDLPLWNILNHTGRGYQIWWCLEESSKKLEFVYKAIQRKLLEKLAEVIDLSSDFSYEIQLDKAASARVAGVFRLFGTMNTKTKSFSKVFIKHNNRYDINELKRSLGIKIRAGRGKRISKAHAPVFHKSRTANLNLLRMNTIKSLIKDRKMPVGNELRELQLFHFYNEAVQYYNDAEKAKEETLELNQLFYVPLPVNQLKAAFRCTDKKVNKNNRGYYIYTNKRIIESLYITEEEQERYGLFPAGRGGGNKNFARDERRRLKKEERNNEIMELHSMGYCYAEIARRAGCSAPTVKTVILSKSKLTEQKVEKSSHEHKESLKIDSGRFLKYFREVFQPSRKKNPAIVATTRSYESLFVIRNEVSLLCAKLKKWKSIYIIPDQTGGG